MNKLIDADLPIGADGRIYHLGLKAGELAPRIITVGDETRAKIMAEKLDADTPKFTYTCFNRHDWNGLPQPGSHV